MNTLKTISFTLIALTAAVFLNSQKNHALPADQKSKPKYNVLFVIVDDLRPELGCYGKNYIHTPNIDAFAKTGLVFNRAYCQQAVCSPSRTSLLTGLRPDSTKVYDLKTHFRAHVPDVVTLPQHFRKNGYYTAAIGKIFHQDFGFDPIGLEDQPSWDDQAWNPEVRSGRGYILDENVKLAKEHNGRGPAFEAAEGPDNIYQDGLIADSAVHFLQKNGSGKPFFLAVGFHKPHLPFTAPKKYWDLYDPEEIKIADPALPENVPPMALQDFGELRAYSGIPKKGPVDEALARKLRHGYFASVSYIDAQFGRIISELKKQGLDKNTVIVLLGDHGYKLGDYANWCKHDNFEIDTRAPLIFSSPGMQAKGKQTNSLVEFLDIYPSLCQEAGIQTPSLQGRSFSPLLNNPQRKFKTAAFSQFPRKGLMGYTMRTDRYRYTVWQKLDHPAEIVAEELYDHQQDDAEKVNLAGDAAYAGDLKRLRILFKDAQMKKFSIN